MGVTIALFLIGAAAALAAIFGVVRGSVYCKGGPYARATQPVAFWMAIVVYGLWSLMMGYFAFLRT